MWNYVSIWQSVFHWGGSFEQLGRGHGGHGGHGHGGHGNVFEDGLHDAHVGGLALAQGLDDGLPHVPRGVAPHRQQGQDVLLPRAGGGPGTGTGTEGAGGVGGEGRGGGGGGGMWRVGDKSINSLLTLVNAK